MASACWNCGRPPAGTHFCGACGALQPPPPDYFDFFELPRHWGLDPAELDRRFYALSRKLHPDVFFRRGERERQYSLDAAAVLNDGYRTLRDPVRRAEYLLKQNGLDIGEQKSSHVPPELLEEVFEWNLALEEQEEAEMKAALKKFVNLRQEADGELAREFAGYDSTGDTEVLGRIRGILNRRRYIQNLVETANGTR